MGEDNFIFLKILHPFRFPFKGYKTVIVNGRKRTHHFRNGKIAFADEVISFFIIGIAQMNVLNISAEVTDGFIGGFSVCAVRMMHIPESAQIIRSKFVHKGTEPCGIGINSACFYKKGNVRSLCIVDEIRKAGSDNFFVIIERNNTDIGNFKVMGGINGAFYHAVIEICLKRNIKRSIKAGDFYSLFTERSCGGAGAVFMERSSFFH